MLVLIYINKLKQTTSLVLHSAPCASLCTEAFTAIEADLEAFSPGRAAGTYLLSTRSFVTESTLSSTAHAAS